MRPSLLDRLCERYLNALDAFDCDEMTRLWKLAERVPGLERAMLELLAELERLDGGE